MKILPSIIFALLILFACKQNTAQTDPEPTSESSEEVNTPTRIIDPNGTTLETRILPPAGYQRLPAEENSYVQYLRNLKLKEDGAPVLLYDGSQKNAQGIVYVAVVDQEIGKKDLHQCADAIMRMRAEFLWESKQYERIHFNFTNGFRCDYSNWMNGKRISVKGNKVSWYSKGGPSNTYKDFWSYMQMVFSYAGTLSLSKELRLKSIEDIEIGDIFIRGGSPGHAVLVIDVAVNSATGDKIFLLSQSYMPAQQTQILNNPNGNLGPWYSTDFGQTLYTPEWTFSKNQLMTFED